MGTAQDVWSGKGLVPQWCLCAAEGGTEGHLRVIQLKESQENGKISMFPSFCGGNNTVLPYASFHPVCPLALHREHFNPDTSGLQTWEAFPHTTQFSATSAA